MHCDDSLERQEVDRFFARDVVTFAEALARVDASASREIPVYGSEAWATVEYAFLCSAKACAEIEQTIVGSRDGNPAEWLTRVQTRFREAVKEWLLQSRLGGHALRRPSGFVGDHHMLKMLYDREISTRGLAGYIDLWLSEQMDLARAVRGRLRSLREYLFDYFMLFPRGEIRVLDVASGPCREFIDLPVPSGRTVNVTALDTDPTSFDYVRRDVVPRASKNTSFRFEQYNVLRTKNASAVQRLFGEFDLIYSVGLCDYISDKTLIAMLRGWREAVDRDGTVYVAFKDSQRL